MIFGMIAILFTGCNQDSLKSASIFYYNDDNKYEGDFRNDKIEDKGIYYYKSSNRYESDWRND